MSVKSSLCLAFCTAAVNMTLTWHTSRHCSYRGQRCAENHNKLHRKFVFYTAISILVIANHNTFRVLFDKIASVHFIWKMYLYFSIVNGQPREPALCQLYRHTIAAAAPLLLAPATVDRYFLPAGRPAANPPHATAALAWFGRHTGR